MAARTILYTGKGGVGKTSVAAASALAIARSGLRTVVISTDPAHSLSDSLEVELGPEPTQIEDNFFGQQIQSQIELERNWSAVQQWLSKLLARWGVEQISAEELTVPPGMDELFALLQLKRHFESGEWDVIVVDCAPTGETLRLLSFPEVARWWLDKVVPSERRLISAARPLAKGILDIDLPPTEVFGEVQELVGNLVGMNEILRDHRTTSIRLVLNPDKMVIREAQRMFTYLNLYGYLTDGVVVNKIFPEELAGGYLGEWQKLQRQNTELVREAFEPVPVLTAPYFEREVIGREMLGRLAGSLYTQNAPEALLYDGISHTLTIDNGTADLKIAVPFAERSDIDLKKRGLELIVKVADQKRNIMLPSSLLRYSPTRAKFDSDTLNVTFEKA